MKNIRLIGIVISVATLLLIPLIAKAPWSLFDYVIIGILFVGLGLAFEFILRHITKTKHRIISGIAILTVFIFVWIELSVGLFGTPFAGN